MIIELFYIVDQIFSLIRHFLTNGDFSNEFEISKTVFVLNRKWFLYRFESQIYVPKLVFTGMTQIYRRRT